MMQKILLVSEVGALARDIEMSGAYNIDFDCQLDGCATEDVEGKTTQSDDTANRLNLLAGIDMRSQHALLAQLLGEWEEPEEQRERDVSSCFVVMLFGTVYVSFATGQREHCVDHPVPSVVGLSEQHVSIRCSIRTSSYTNRVR